MMHGRSKRSRLRDLAAERQRRYRARQATGKISIQICINEVDVIEALVASGLLDRVEAENREKLSCAIEKIIQIWTNGRYA
jgi:hypothetical protein